MGLQSNKGQWKRRTEFCLIIAPVLLVWACLHTCWPRIMLCPIFTLYSSQDSLKPKGLRIERFRQRFKSISGPWMNPRAWLLTHPDRVWGQAKTEPKCGTYSFSDTGGWWGWGGGFHHWHCLESLVNSDNKIRLTFIGFEFSEDNAFL